jgi:formylglycine-generating enzyme
MVRLASRPPADRRCDSRDFGSPGAGEPESGSVIELDGGSFLTGSDVPEGFPEDGEGPVREVQVEPFAIAAHAVTNEQFAGFVEDTGHVTRAERFGNSFVFAGLLPDDFPTTRAVAQAPWWRQVEGADWRRPEGPGSSLDGRAGHPVVHVSWTDARAYCRWAGMRLPSEAEWELAARGGLVQKRYPWGDELTPGGEHRCNIWQGTFPTHNTLEDGYLGTAPVDTFPPNDFGLHNTSGNVWEWCADWFDRGSKVIRGGSYLCHHSYCNRYRVAARSRNTPETSTGHMGFRVANG